MGCEAVWSGVKLTDNNSLQALVIRHCVLGFGELKHHCVFFPVGSAGCKGRREKSYDKNKRKIEEVSRHQLILLLNGFLHIPNNYGDAFSCQVSQNHQKQSVKQRNWNPMKPHCQSRRKSLQKLQCRKVNRSKETGVVGNSTTLIEFRVMQNQSKT